MAAGGEITGENSGRAAHLEDVEVGSQVPEALEDEAVHGRTRHEAAQSLAVARL